MGTAPTHAGTMLTMAEALQAADAALRAGREQGFAPLAVVVLDAGGHDLVVLRAETASLYRVPIARTKAAGCLGMGMGGRELARRAQAVPAFYAALAAVTPQGLVPVPGGVLIRGEGGGVIGAIGISGDTADHDEAAALAGLAAAGLTGDTGAE